MRHTSILFAGCLWLSLALLLGYAWRHPVPRHAITPIELNYRVNVNTADVHRLQLLPGVGPGIAQHLVDYRERAGRFDRPTDLEQVPYIGPRTRARIEPWVSFGEEVEGAEPSGAVRSR